MSDENDVTPRMIADRLCPEAAGPVVYRMIEAMAERAIELTLPGKFPRMQASLVERNVVLAARVIIQRSNERLENPLIGLQGSDDDDEETEAP
jgi:hypothetical protein